MSHPENPAGQPNAHTHRHWPKLFFSGLMGGYVLYIVLGYFIVPRLVVNNIEKLVRQTANSRFSAHRVVFNPFTLSLRIDKPVLMDLEDETIWFQAGAVVVNVNGLSSALRRSTVLDSLTVKHPVIYFQQDHDGGWRYPHTPATGNLPIPGAFDLQIEQLYLTGGQMHWQQMGKKSASLTLTHVEYRHERLNTGRLPSRFSVSTKTLKGARLHASGQYIHQTQDLDATWHIDRLNLPYWLDTWRISFPGLSIQQASLSGNGLLRWDGRNNRLNLSASHMTLQSVRVIRPQQRADAPSTGNGPEYPSVVIPNITIDKWAWSLPERQLHIQHLKLSQAVAYLPLQILDTIGSHTHSTQAGTPALAWWIERASADDSRLRLGNTSLDIGTMRLDNLNNAGDNTRINIDLTVPAGKNGITTQAGRIRITGQFNLARAVADFSHHINHVALAPWLPLVQRYLKVSRIDGQISSTGQWRFLSHGFSGEFQANVSDFSLWDFQQQQVLAWNQWRTEQNHIDSFRRRMRVGPMTIRELSSDIRLQAVGDHLKSLLRNHPTPPKKEKNATRPPPWRIEWQSQSSLTGSSAPP